MMSGPFSDEEKKVIETAIRKSLNLSDSWPSSDKKHSQGAKGQAGLAAEGK